MAATVHLTGFRAFHLPAHTSSSPQPKTLAPASTSFSSYSPEAPSLRSIPGGRGPRRRQKGFRGSFLAASVLKISDAELVLIPSEGSGEIEGLLPPVAGVYGVYDKNEELQFIGISRNIAASIMAHRKSVQDLCWSVKVGLVDGENPDKTVLTDAWKSWMEEHLAATGKIPPGNQSENNTWVRRPHKKPDLRLTPGRHVQLAVPLEQLIDKLVKENEVVAFIKGSRTAPQCGFSQRVVGILESHGVDFECVDVLDEEHNSGLRETLKSYSNWPTFPQVFVRGELLGGCDIISSMAEKGELAAFFKK
ncbi:Monothiol glutaredoxin-S12, chloroplastic [Apostasia shenzhenica]|uniref:Monothiol glutaredoxin-S12, chloroplastic n=1 Tax=Apostasia shenzhenica TaxID=1088818 RepID=A0A2I0B690_9ASPA|nr:Monothiol glutaredoxin-S12, chloroplastic [Apostasia shenzhenica]